MSDDSILRYTDLAAVTPRGLRAFGSNDDSTSASQTNSGGIFSAAKISFKRGTWV